MGVSGRHVDRSIRTDEVMYFATDKVAQNITYYGRTEGFDSSDSDTVWQIKRVERNGNTERVRYANNGKYNCKWSDRVTYFPNEPTHQEIIDDLEKDAAKKVYTYDGNGNIKQIDYYTGVSNKVNISFPTVSLASEYWLFENVSGSSQFYVWYRIDGVGTDPAIVGRAGIMVDCASNFADIVAATVSGINASVANSFCFANAVNQGTISLSHKQYGAPVQPSSTMMIVTPIKQGTNLDFSGVTYLQYDGSNNITEQIRVNIKEFL